MDFLSGRTKLFVRIGSGCINAPFDRCVVVLHGNELLVADVVVGRCFIRHFEEMSRTFK